MTSADFDPVMVPIRPAATVMLLRDHPLNGVDAEGDRGRRRLLSMGSVVREFVGSEFGVG